jgi:hypothetical protein
MKAKIMYKYGIYKYSHHDGCGTGQNIISGDYEVVKRSFDALFRENRRTYGSDCKMTLDSLLVGDGIINEIQQFHIDMDCGGASYTLTEYLVA